MNSKIEDILEKYNIHGGSLEKTASDDVIGKAKIVQEKIAQAITEEENFIEKIASGLSDEESKILKYADFV
jgi:hypothetical protein